MKGSQGTFFFYTTDGEKVRKHEGGVAIAVEIARGRIRTHLSGPENTMLKKPEEIRLPLTIDSRQGQGRGLGRSRRREKFFLNEEDVQPLGPGRPSGPAWAIKVRAICRFLITGLEPHFEMYVTPLNIDPEKPALPISHPFIYSVYLAKLLGRYITLGEANDTWALNEGVLGEQPFLDLTYSNHAEWEAMLSNALEKTPRGLVTIVFETTDSIQHMFFRYLDKGHPALKKPGQNGAQRPGHRGPLYQDGRPCRPGPKGAGRRGASSSSCPTTASSPSAAGVNLNSWLLKNGYLALKDGKPRSGEWFKDVDWEKTRAYALGLGGALPQRPRPRGQGDRRARARRRSASRPSSSRSSPA